MKLEELQPGASVTGVEPTQIVSVLATVPMGEGSVQLIYRTPDGAMKERLLSRVDEQSINLATAERPFSFDGDGAAFQLACEAKRIDLAFLFDPMMAVHTSNVEPLPHQITAVYESMLPRQPLRFIVPAGLMNTLRGDEPVDPVASTFAADAAARKRIEQLAMNAVRRLGRRKDEHHEDARGES